MLEALREAVYQADLELPQRGLVLYTWGNVSGIDRARGLDPVAVPGVLCRSHGPSAWGGDPAQAVYYAAVLEQVAPMALLTRQIAPAPQYVLDKHYQRKHGPHAYYGQNRQ